MYMDTINNPFAEGLTLRQCIPLLKKQYNVEIGLVILFRMLRATRVFQINNTPTEEYDTLGYFDQNLQVIGNRRGKEVATNWKVYVSEAGLKFLGEHLQRHFNGKSGKNN